MGSQGSSDLTGNSVGDQGYREFSQGTPCVAKKYIESSQGTPCVAKDTESLDRELW